MLRVVRGYPSFDPEFRTERVSERANDCSLDPYRCGSNPGIRCNIYGELGNVFFLTKSWKSSSDSNRVISAFFA